MKYPGLIHKIMADENKTPEQKLATFDVKAMLDQHAKAGTKIRYTDRMEIEYITDTKFHRKGERSTPHAVKAQALIDQKIAKKVSKD